MSLPGRLTVLLGLVLGGCLPPEWGANAILHPSRRALTASPDPAGDDVTFTSDGIELKGWAFRTQAPRRGWIVYLHGIADNRQSAIGFAQRFVPQGYDVLAYDSRAHGASAGTFVTYGAKEKHDVVKGLDAVGADRAVLFGCSLGASVALLAAPLDGRIRGVVAQSPFSDLRAVVHDRRPWVATRSAADRALDLAAARGGFALDETSAVRAAPDIRVPVLLIHGAADRDTPPAHSRRIFAALGGPKELVVVPGAGHDNTLASADTWTHIEQWLGRVLEAAS